MSEMMSKGLEKRLDESRALNFPLIRVRSQVHFAGCCHDTERAGVTACVHRTA